MKKKPIYILGTATSHDGSTCLLKDGKIVVAIEKERLTRIKHDGGNDNVSIQYCLDVEGIKISDIDLIVQWDYERLYDYSITVRNSMNQRHVNSLKVPIVNISHQLAHAYSTIGPVNFDEFNILIVDGSGSPYFECIDVDGNNTMDEIFIKYPKLFIEKDSFYNYSNGILKTIMKDFSEASFPMSPNLSKHSIGGIYEAFSIYCLDPWQTQVN